jgi:hypothetical protein
MRMRLLTTLVLIAGISWLAGPAGVLADGTEVQYQVTNVSGDEWQYSYAIEDSTPFSANEALTVTFSAALYTNMDPAPPSPAGWSAFSAPSDTTLMFDGIYTASANADGASLAGPFTITFDYLGSGTPGSQPFSIDLFDSNSIYLSNVTTGVTTPFSNAVPEPESGLLLLIGGVALSGLKKRFVKRQVSIQG